jgi:hypothetical protein
MKEAGTTALFSYQKCPTNLSSSLTRDELKLAGHLTSSKRSVNELGRLPDHLLSIEQDQASLRTSAPSLNSAASAPGAIRCCRQTGTLLLRFAPTRSVMFAP